MKDLPGFRPSDQKDRLWPVDVLRGFAVIGMVEAHVYNVSADPILLAHPLAPWLDALNGLVAPLFFVLTGFVLQLRPANTAGTLGRRLRNAAGWWVLAMLLHLPLINAGRGGINFSPCLHFDVLHALAASAFSRTLVQWGSGAKPRPRLLAGTTLAVLILTTLSDRLQVAEALNP